MSERNTGIMSEQNIETTTVSSLEEIEILSSPNNSNPNLRNTYNLEAQSKLLSCSFNTQDKKTLDIVKRGEMALHSIRADLFEYATPK